MNPEIVSSDSTTTEVERPEVLEVNNNETQLLLPAKSSADSSTAQWQQYGEQIAAFLQGLPSYVANFFGKNRGPLGSIGLIVAVLITVKLILALVDAIDDIPLVAPIFELIGLGYTAWFVYRYLLSAASRQELSQEIQALKNQVFGTES
jgi:hypothetical protein